MLARGFAPAGRTAKNLSDSDFLPICTGMRTLHPSCDLIVSLVAANDMHRLEDIEEAVVELVKDSCRKLNDKNNKGKMVVPNPAIPRVQVVVHASSLPPGAPNQWGAATPIGNPGQLPPNHPPAQIPAGGQRSQAPAGAAGPNVPAAQINVPAARQLGQAPPAEAGPKVAAAGQLGQARPGAAGQNVPAGQVNVPAAGQLGQPPSGVAGPNLPAAQVNVSAARQLGQAPPGAGGPNILAAQVNVAAAGQLGQARPGAAGPNVPAEQVNVAAAAQLGQPPVGYVNQNDVRNWAHDPAQCIGQMHSRELLDDRPADREGSDTDDASEDDTSYLSVSSSGLSDSAHGSEILFTILPCPPVGHAKWPANRISLLAQSWNEQNRQLPLKVLHRPAHGKDHPMQGLQFDEDYRGEDTREKHRLNYLIKVYRISEERRTCHAGFDAQSREDPKSKRVPTYRWWSENLTGELMDSMARRLSAMSTLMSRGLVIWTVIAKGH